jgi:hypothetical protein
MPFEWLQKLVDAVLGGIYDGFMWLLQWIVIIIFKLLEVFTSLVTEVVQFVLVDINIGQYLSFALLPNDVAQFLGYLAVPQALNMILTASLIRFMLSFIPL